MRRTMLILLVVAMFVSVIALPALAAGPFTYRETSHVECAYYEHVTSRIYAVGDHMHHLWGGYYVQLDLSWAWHTSRVDWSPWEGSVDLYNQTGGAYSYPSSHAYCRR